VSQHNVELARDLLAKWNRGDRDDLSPLHPDIEWLPARAATEGAYRGLAGFEDFVADTARTFEVFELHAELRDLGDRVLGWGTIHMRARKSGVEMDIPVGALLDFRDGKIVRFEDFGSKEAALKAAGV
jgi:ketosteroid isomerase-like protein